MQMRETITAIVLAGGQSSRMGQDKALILVEGVPLLRRVCEIALQCCPEVYVVTAWGDRYRSILPATCHLISEVALPGATGTHGPLVGFAQGLVQVQADWVLLLACDLPKLQPQVIQQWLAELPKADAAVMAMLCQGNKGWEPLCGFYRRNCLTQLDAYIAKGGRSFQSWLATLKVQPLPHSDHEMFFNCNTPEDLAALAFHQN
jgi:molybdenum cofactor guanylyltransferase